MTVSFSLVHFFYKRQLLNDSIDVRVSGSLLLWGNDSIDTITFKDEYKLFFRIFSKRISDFRHFRRIWWCKDSVQKKTNRVIIYFFLLDN